VRSVGYLGHALSVTAQGTVDHAAQQPVGGCAVGLTLKIGRRRSDPPVAALGELRGNR
jgi:hypothetical protein